MFSRKKVIPIYYWNGSKNFGDQLAPYIIEKLSGKKTKYYPILTPLRSIKIIIYKFFTKGKIELSDIKNLFLSNTKLLISVGSILYTECKYNRNNVYWGSGFMRSSSECSPKTPCSILAVRGLKSIEKLKDAGIECSHYGDPALLLPLLYQSKSKQEVGKIGIIPHFSEIDHFRNTYHDSYEVIDLRTDDIHSVIDKICECSYILSTSLHGIIVAHAYGVPALWIEHNNIGTDGFKFYDYFTSVGLPEYVSIRDFDEKILNKESAKDAVNGMLQYDQILMPKKDVIKQRQLDLMRSAPFVLKDKFKSFLNNN